MNAMRNVLVALAMSAFASTGARAKDSPDDFDLKAGRSIDIAATGEHQIVVVPRADCSPTQAALWLAICVVPADVEFRDPGVDAPVQRLQVERVRFYRNLPSRPLGGYEEWAPAMAETPDLDFDGHSDLLLSIDVPESFIDHRATAFVWDPRTRQYRRDDAISALSETAWLDVDAQARRLVVKERAPGLAGPDADIQYRVVDGKPVLEKKTVRTVRADGSATDVVESEWLDGAWKDMGTRQEAPPPPAPMAPAIYN